MKLLFITSKDVKSTSNGGELCTNRNYLSFCELIGENNVDTINLLETINRSFLYKIRKRINLFFGLDEGLTKSVLINLKREMNFYDVIFIDTSLFGFLAAYLRSKGYNGKIITFYHNVEQVIKRQKLKYKPYKFAEYVVSIYNEKKAWKHSDSVIAVNKRDKQKLISKYGERHVEIIPISLIDRYNNQGSSRSNSTYKFLFIGNNWYANIEGINWFIKHVLEHVDIKLQITGHKMVELEKYYKHHKIEFLGFVEDLDSILVQADAIISPIFTGSGMKVKTCEALMFGKNIIGTKESFEGYEIDPFHVGGICDSSKEFISSINKYILGEGNKFNVYNRAIYLEKYSFSATLPYFKRLI